MKAFPRLPLERIKIMRTGQSRKPCKIWQRYLSSGSRAPLAQTMQTTCRQIPSRYRCVQVA